MNQKIYTSAIDYVVHGQTMRGFLAYDKTIDQKRPAVLIAPAWRGLDDFAKNKAVELAETGYVAFAADVYGNGKTATNNEESLQLMLPLFKERLLLQERILSALQLVRGIPLADKNKIGAIGFCFGGLTILELLRSGADICGIVSFHAILADTLGDVKARRPPNAPQLKGAALFFHGSDDPMVSSLDVKSLQEELDEADIDWQFHTFGKTMHAFTNPIANQPEQGLLYNPQAAKRAWQQMHNFFNEQFYQI